MRDATPRHWPNGERALKHGIKCELSGHARRTINCARSSLPRVLIGFANKNQTRTSTSDDSTGLASGSRIPILILNLLLTNALGFVGLRLGLCLAPRHRLRSVSRPQVALCVRRARFLPPPPNRINFFTCVAVCVFEWRLNIHEARIKKRINKHTRRARFLGFEIGSAARRDLARRQGNCESNKDLLFTPLFGHKQRLAEARRRSPNVNNETRATRRRLTYKLFKDCKSRGWKSQQKTKSSLMEVCEQLDCARQLNCDHKAISKAEACDFVSVIFLRNAITRRLCA